MIEEGSDSPGVWRLCEQDSLVFFFAAAVSSSRLMRRRAARAGWRDAVLGQRVPLSAMSWRRAVGRWRRDALFASVHAGWRAMQQAGAVTAESAAGRKFAAFDPHSLMAFPTGAVFGERWIEVGDETMFAEQATLCAGMMPGHDGGKY